MKSNTRMGGLLAGVLGISALGSAPAAAAEPAKGKVAPAQEVAPPAASEPAATKKPVGLPFPGVMWGMSTKNVIDVVDRLLDDDYRPLLKDTQPGIQQQRLDAKLVEEKAEFRGSRIEFGKLPTGVDTTPLRGEFTYENNEMLMSITRHGMTTSFFFIQGRLWKIIEERQLGEDGHGRTFAEAVAACASAYGVNGRQLPAGPGQYANEVDWRDQSTHVRAIQRGDTGVALAFEDNVTLGLLPTLRTAKPADPNAIDPDVAAAIRKDPPPEVAKPEAKPGPKTQPKKGKS